MKHCFAHVREAAVLAIEEANRPLCTQEIEEWMWEHLPDTHREAKTMCNDYYRLILSLQLSIVKYRANSPKALSRPPVFYGLPDAQYGTDNWILIDRRYKSVEKCSEATERELAPAPTAEHSDQYMLSCLISGMNCDQAWNLVVNRDRVSIF
jgi:hypothetical protein